ncbi:LexA/Signal peptidase [Cylindrobasidium torrendii FP15055 ss-10]|uniref:Mitochondrial inner membrane protease subunit 2 n=1 Tax=Cylindrobasidium torrendii FP15055 ss-10 TaxID=1314674 RepID=A0A0D7BTE1_9AGAR|nr:LexA/Signal peptidase [Cylindrobasidium torrendii FP15055 ss-10]
MGRFSPFLRTLWLLPVPLAIMRFYPVNKIVGRSMQPTLNPDSNCLREDYALFDRVSVQANAEFERGDIVTVTSPVNPRRTLVKRVLAKAGDLVETMPPYPEQWVRVPDGHVWIEGDESFHSDDSRTFGPIAAGLISAKLLCIIWPLDRFGAVNPPTEDILKTIPRDSPAYREALSAMAAEKKRRSRVHPQGGSVRCLSSHSKMMTTPTVSTWLFTKGGGFIAALSYVSFNLLSDSSLTSLVVGVAEVDFVQIMQDFFQRKM